jgi:hypothetical protein
MNNSRRSSKPEASMSPAEQWDALNEEILAKQPLQQAPAPSSYTWDGDDIDPPPSDSPAANSSKKDAIDFLLEMLDPLITLDDEPHTYKAGRQTLRQTDSPDGIRNAWDIDMELEEALREYRRRLTTNPTYDYRVPLRQSVSNPRLPEARFRQLIGNVFRKIKAPYKVGASLYVYHQMHVLRKSTLPSLSKAQYLVDNAPLRQTQSIPHKRRGDHRKIGENWARYFPASHYWAAFVVMAGNPFVLPDDALARFVLHYEVEEFKRLAATFLHFRRSLKATTTTENIRNQQHISRALDTDLTRADFGDTPPMPDIEIPSLVADFQWQWLRQYSSDRQEAALRRPRKGMLADDESGW